MGSEMCIRDRAGSDALGNPLASVDVAVSNGLGSHAAADGFVFAPAIVATELARLGRDFEIGLRATPGALFVLGAGSSVPGFGIPIPPFGGSLEVVVNLVVLQTGVSSGDPEELVLPVPDDPALGGKAIDFQGFVLFDPLAPAGTFTNRLAVTLYP